MNPPLIFLGGLFILLGISLIIYIATRKNGQKLKAKARTE